MVTEPYPDLAALQAVEHHLAHAAVSLSRAFGQATDWDAANELDGCYQATVKSLKIVRRQIQNHPAVPRI